MTPPAHLRSVPAPEAPTTLAGFQSLQLQIQREKVKGWILLSFLIPLAVFASGLAWAFSQAVASWLIG